MHFGNLLFDGLQTVLIWNSHISVLENSHQTLSVFWHSPTVSICPDWSTVQVIHVWFGQVDPLLPMGRVLCFQFIGRQKIDFTTFAFVESCCLKELFSLWFWIDGTYSVSWVHPLQECMSGKASQFLRIFRVGPLENLLKIKWSE